MEVEFEARLSQLGEAAAENRAEHKSFKRRLDALEAHGKKTNEILLTLQRQADAIESINKKIDGVADSVSGVAERVNKMEREPVERWKKIGFEIIKYIVLAGVGAIIGIMAK